MNDVMTQDILYNVNSFLGYEGRILNKVSKSIRSENSQYKLLNLNRKYSKLFYYDEEFREEVLKSVNYDRSKISLNLSGIQKYNIETVFKMGTIIRREINNDENNIKDLSILKDIHTLDLSYNDDITDVSMLSGVYDLDLTNCPNITNVHMLNNVHNLKMSKFRSIV